MRILLVHLPFSTPFSSPYSLTNLYVFLSNNGSADVSVLDLNIKFHTLKFPEANTYFQSNTRETYMNCDNPLYSPFGNKQ